MTLSRKRVAALGLAGAGVLTAVAALLEWWGPALALLALLNGGGLALLVLGVGQQAELRRLQQAVAQLERRVEKVTARVVATGEATRVELVDALSGIVRTVPERQGAEAGRDRG
jgi:hypothetical protein